MAGLLYMVAIVLTTIICRVNCDYECVCNYNVEQSVLPMPDESSQPLGFMYEFDCKPTAEQGSLDASEWLAIAFEHKLGYIQTDGQVQQQICPGEPPSFDILTTTTSKPTTSTTTPTPTTTSTTTPKPTTTTTTPKPTTTTTTPKPTTPTTTPTTTTTTTTPTPTTTTTTPKPTTTSTTPKPTTPKPTTTTTTPKPTTTTTTPKPTTTTTTPKPTTTTTTPKPTTTSTTPKPTTTSTTPKPTTQTTTPTTTVDPIVGNTLLCPSTVRYYSGKEQSILAQYETHCYELIMTNKDTWNNAESKCTVRGGHLADIIDAGEQLFITTFLQNFTPNHAVWIGLNDRTTEGKFVWSSGVSATYFNWYSSHANHFTSHDTEDCTVIIPYKKGQWDDLPCQIYHNTAVHYPTLCEYQIPQ